MPDGSSDLERIAAAGVAAFENYVAEDKAISEAWRTGTLGDWLAKKRKEINDGERGDTDSGS